MEETHASLLLEFDHVAKKQRHNNQFALENIDFLCEQLTRAKEALAAAADGATAEGASPKACLDALAKGVQDAKVAHKFSEEQKELYNGLQKYAKLLDKVLLPELGNVVKLSGNGFEPRLLNLAVAHHLFRVGRLNSALLFSKEAAVDVPPEMREPFVEMSQVVLELKRSNLAPALKWAQSHRAALAKDGHALEFRLHKILFVAHLAAGRRREALDYARANFGLFATSQTKEIQRLMCALLYIKRLASSPYADLLAGTLWADATQHFTRTYCSIVGLAPESPLYVGITAGYTALPTLIKMANVMRGKLPDVTTSTIQVDLELGRTYQFHSVFTCPVSKEQATLENPPMLLACGHAIAKASMIKLAKGGSARFKCPYCPTEQATSQAMEISF